MEGFLKTGHARCIIWSDSPRGLSIGGWRFLRCHNKLRLMGVAPWILSKRYKLTSCFLTWKLPWFRGCFDEGLYQKSMFVKNRMKTRRMNNMNENTISTRQEWQHESKSFFSVCQNMHFKRKRCAKCMFVQGSVSCDVIVQHPKVVSETTKPQNYLGCLLHHPVSLKYQWQWTYQSLVCPSGCNGKFEWGAAVDFHEKNDVWMVSFRNWNSKVISYPLLLVGNQLDDSNNLWMGDWSKKPKIHD